MLKSHHLIDFRVILDIKLQVQKLEKYLEYFNMENEKKERKPKYIKFIFLLCHFMALKKSVFFFYSLLIQSVMALQLYKDAKFSAEFRELTVDRKILTGSLRFVSML